MKMIRYGHYGHFTIMGSLLFYFYHDNDTYNHGHEDDKQ